MAKVVLYTPPRPGHLISMVELGKLLLSQNSSLSIIILIPTFPHVDFSTLTPYISSVSSSFSSISFHTLPSQPLLLGDISNYSTFEQINFESLSTNLSHVQAFLESISPVFSFIIDFFCYPALHVSKSLGIPTSFFFTSSASALAFFLNFPVFDKIIENDSFRNLGNTPFEIPGLFSVPASHMIEPMLDRGVSYDEFVKMGIHLPKSDSIIVNTFESLEPRAVKSLKEGTCLPGTHIPPVYCIGPLFSKGEEKKGDKRMECLSWLDLQPTKSVVYLCFGSRGLFSKKQLDEIAIGLEKSGVRFLWVVRAPPTEDKVTHVLSQSDPDLETILPSGFLDRTKDRGFVVKSWAPQIAILGHEAIGGFVTHCGWNSTLEAVAAGVPMVAWPLYAEQRFNKILLVDEIKVALPMVESDDRFVESMEIDKRVKEIIDSEEGKIVRKRVMELSHQVKVVFDEGGLSKMTLIRLLESWKH